MEEVASNDIAFVERNQTKRSLCGRRIRCFNRLLGNYHTPINNVSMNVLSAKKAQSAFLRLGLPFQFTEQELHTYSTTCIVNCPEGVLAFPTPHDNAGLNLLNLRRLLGVDPSKPPSFFDHPWYLDESFGAVDCAPGWHLLYMDPLQDSVHRPYNYIYSFEKEGMAAPAAIEVILMLFLRYVETGEQLLMKKHTWCVDRASMGRRVTVGAFGRNGVFLSAHPEAFASRGLGVCPKLTLPGSGAPSR
jgi:hypothetical protein